MKKSFGTYLLRRKITDYDVRALMHRGTVCSFTEQPRPEALFWIRFRWSIRGTASAITGRVRFRIGQKRQYGGAAALQEHKIYAGKPGLPGLPATFGSEEECETLEIVLADEVLDLTVTLYYTAFYDVDVIT